MTAMTPRQDQMWNNNNQKISLTFFLSHASQIITFLTMPQQKNQAWPFTKPDVNHEFNTTMTANNPSSRPNMKWQQTRNIFNSFSFKMLHKLSPSWPHFKRKINQNYSKHLMWTIKLTQQWLSWPLIETKCEMTTLNGMKFVFCLGVQTQLKKDCLNPNGTSTLLKAGEWIWAEI